MANSTGAMEVESKTTPSIFPVMDGADPRKPPGGCAKVSNGRNRPTIADSKYFIRSTLKFYNICGKSNTNAVLAVKFSTKGLFSEENGAFEGFLGPKCSKVVNLWRLM